MDPNQARNLFTNWTIMYNQFLTLFGQNPGTTQGMLQVCNGIETFNLCMFGNMDCMFMGYLANQTDDIAFMSRGVYDMYANFNCGPGINTLLHEGLACSQRIMSGYQNTLQACVTTYQSSVTHDPSNGCQYATGLINCWSAPFYTAPCRRERSADVWWALIRGPFTTEEYLDTHHKVIDGVHHFKIPDYIGLVDGKKVKVEGPWMHD
ncbi:hypothetical protein WR25_19675 [Diploscapter pachys]|uniref:Uncharacterized protein n=1 Tax=Diploscapter pachys TaxID=2018661 RepID=A0A2A2JVL1_9BILA|nr:hypothetical protein WR25_19675 [Diploscapter pachys]